MKRTILRTAAIVLAAVLFCPLRARALSAQKAILMDASTGRVLYERRADEESLIASTTKIMTALVVCQQCNVLDRVRIPEEAVGIEGSSLYLEKGEVLTVQELLYGMMLHSGNDAAVALAIYAGGTPEGFAELMNDKARELGLKGTHFANPNGLDAPDHHSTARDLAVLSAEAMENPIFRKTVSTRTIKIGPRYLANHNKLLWRLEGADGVKTGYTRAAGRILVSSAARQGRRLVCVTIAAPDDWNDHIALMEGGFRDYRPVKLISEGQILGKRHVVGGTGQEAAVKAGADFVYALAQGECPQTVIDSRPFAYAPVREGGDAGTAYCMLENRVIGKIPLLWAQNVDLPEESGKNILKKWFGGTFEWKDCKK